MIYDQHGVDLFDSAAQSSQYHSTDGITGDGSPALLTDFSYDNLGVPANHQIPGKPDFDSRLLGNPNLDIAHGEPPPN